MGRSPRSTGSGGPTSAAPGAMSTTTGAGVGSENQKKLCGPIVSRYGSSPIFGNGVRPAEPGVPVAAPLHRCADPVSVAEVDVVPHPDLVPVVDDRGAGHGEQQRVHQLNAAAVVLQERGEPAADTQVDPGRAVLRVG